MRSDTVRRITVNVNHKRYVVEIRDVAPPPFTVLVNGRPYRVSVENGAGAIAPASTAPAAGESTAREGLSAPAALLNVGPAGRQAEDLRSPMPGNILDIAVQAGDRVAYGQQLCALEAMKMKSAIKSPREGVIAEVKVRAGQAVGYGEVLFTFA